MPTLQPVSASVGRNTWNSMLVGSMWVSCALNTAASSVLHLECRDGNVSVVTFDVAVHKLQFSHKATRCT